MKRTASAALTSAENTAAAERAHTGGASVRQFIGNDDCPKIGKHHRATMPRMGRPR